ncbi:hypothetical protein BGZ58_000008 [Dissophora ornata]|nr:hypothetical protein BGZ58_000008 [Dissophora ornata]
MTKRNRRLLGLKNHPITGVNQDEEEYGCNEYEYEDEEAEEKDEEGRRDEVVNHPIYGMLTCALEVQGGEFRHDRKDSGVFVYSDDRDGILDGPFAFPEHSLKLFPASANHADAGREHHGHSAAYISLQCIASSFPSK